MKKEYNKIYEEVVKKSNKKLSTYRQLKKLHKQMRKLKPKSDRHYRKEKEIAEWYALGIGLLACTIDINDESKKEEYRRDSAVYFCLLTNIANNICSIIKVVDSGYEFGANIIIRNLIELIYTFLVALLNPEKRKEYYDSGKLQNEYSVWARNFKMSKLNEEISKYDSKVVEDEDFLKELRKIRNRIYKEYSSYTHNDYDVCILSCFGLNPKNKNLSEDAILEYNIWGACNYRGEIILDSLNRIIFMAMLYFKHIISKTDYFNEEDYVPERNLNTWYDGIAILFLLETEMKKSWKEKGEF